MILFRSERKRWATPASSAPGDTRLGLPEFDQINRELFEKALPRGVLTARLDADRARENYWMSIHELMRFAYQPGQLIIGKVAGTFLGHLDDRPLVTIANARTGKTSTVLVPNLYLYPGSMLILDPKKELLHTASFRRAVGHDTYVLNPFPEPGETTACYNPLDELDPDSPTLIDDVAALAGALVMDNGDARSQHWNDSARTLLTGILLLTLTLPPGERHLVTVRELLTLTYPPLLETAKRAAALAARTEGGKQRYFKENLSAVETLLELMVRIGGRRFGGILAATGNRFLSTPPIERGSIFSTAAAQTDFLDSISLRAILRRSDFRLGALRSDRPTSIYLCLPVRYMERHSRWLRLIVQLACMVLERKGVYPRDRPPILFMMEEFATLGHMEMMERAAAYFPGFGIKLWIILQSLEQLSRYYKNSQQTFLGNAGLVQMFASGDAPALEYVTDRVGKLIEPFELRTAFARDRFSQLLLMEGLPPAAALRLDHRDVDGIRLGMLGTARSRGMLVPPLPR